MKLSEIHPCDNCTGQIVPQFYLLRVSLAIVDAKAMNQVMGLAQQLGGGVNDPKCLAIAETMASRPDVFIIAGEKEPSLMTDVFICEKCFLSKHLDLARIIEAIHDREKKAREAQETIA